MVLVLDNRDSFVHNLARYVRELGEDADVRRSDALTRCGGGGARAHAHHHLARTLHASGGRHLSRRRPQPGPAHSRSSACASDTSASAPPTARRSSGLASRYTGERHASRTGAPASSQGLPSPLLATRYHSLVIAKDSLPDDLRVIATSEDDEEIMAVMHTLHPVVGVQFHPESAASEWGYAMLDAFLHGQAGRCLISGADALAAS